MYAQHLVDIPRLMNPQTNTSTAVTDTPSKSQRDRNSNSFSNIIRRTSEKLVLLEQQQAHHHQQQQNQFHLQQLQQAQLQQQQQAQSPSRPFAGQGQPQQYMLVRPDRSHYVDGETRHHIDTANGVLSQYMHLLANEPSIGMFVVCVEFRAHSEVCLMFATM